MKKKIILTLFALSLSTYSIITLNQSAEASQKDAAQKNPKLVIASPEHSFGKVKPGAPLTHTFKIRNDGKADLEIKSVSPACGCTAANFDKIVSPGKEGGITLKIEHTEGYKGEVIKTAEVATNDQDRRTFTLTLRANFSE
jgi:hypothetical protein